MTFLDYAVPFILLLGALIFIHELGHYLVAKAFNVKVERFSLGFGHAIFRRTVGETEYVIAWLPLGGYVKMLGELPGEELPPAERARSFNGQAVWKRVAISLAGPVMNLVLPVVVLAGVFMSGMPVPTSRIGAVVPGSAAEQAGLEPGDRIVAVGGEPVSRWEGVTDAVQRAGDAPLAFAVERQGERYEFEVVPEDGRLGIDHSAPAAAIGIVARDAPAARAGLQTGDRIVAVGGRELDDWYDLGPALAAAPPSVELEVARRLEDGEETLRIALPEAAEPWTLERLGIMSGDVAVAAVDPNSPAARAGLEPGDLILSIDGEPLISFRALAARIRSGGGAEIALVVLRDGARVPVRVRPEERVLERQSIPERVFAIGITGGAPAVPGEYVEEVIRNPLLALWRGTERTTEILVRTLDGLGKLVRGEVGRESLAGPIGIGMIAAEFYRVGWLEYLHIMAVISVNLAILNLLPVPILDGGQIVLALIEGIKGRPLGARSREIAQQVGLSLLVLLMGFAFWNDLSRYWSRIVGFFEGLV
jgi:regulator of sigma E protease